MDHPLDGDQLNDLMHAFVDIDADDPSDDESFKRTAELFNRIYRMGQRHERERWTARGVPAALVKRDAR